MSDLSYMDKLNIQLQENESNFARSKEACEESGIDTHYTMGQAIQLFVSTHNLYDFGEPDLRNEFHDAMHIAALAHNSTARGEALAGVVEQTLLREPYNGDTNQKLAAARNTHSYVMSAVVGTRKFNPAGHEDFEKPAPVGSFESAIALGKERFDFTSSKQKPSAPVSEEDMAQAYQRAVDIDAFFQSLAGGRAVYQLSSQELLDMPVAFFGLEKTGEDHELQFSEISQDKRQEILDTLDDQNITLHQIERAKTVDDLHALGLEWPEQPLSHLEP